MVEMTLAERPFVARKRLFNELITMPPSTVGGDRNYIEKFLSIRDQLAKLGYDPDGYIFFDILHTKISRTWREFIQQRVDTAIQSNEDASSMAQNTNLPENNVVGLLRDILQRLPTASNMPPAQQNSQTNATTSTDSNNKDSKKANSGRSGWQAGRGVEEARRLEASLLPRTSPANTAYERLTHLSVAS